jgi:type III pantothenate kinase
MDTTKVIGGLLDLPTGAKKDDWIGLAIGNSRLHWAWFTKETLQKSWDTDHLIPSEVEQVIQKLTSPNSEPPPLYLASVVPTQIPLWQRYPATHLITLNQLPLKGLYPTLGIDRALAVLGAGEKLGFPVLVIDAGTALTFTGADSQRNLIGGAILPGFRLQLQSLAQKTAALPTVALPEALPPRWALQTDTAIESGVIYTVLAGVRDFIEQWRDRFPNSQIALTGGDSTILLTYLKTQFSQTATEITADPNLIFWGMQRLALRAE